MDFTGWEEKSAKIGKKVSVVFPCQRETPILQAFHG
jgi:hypothetical protein